MAAKNALFSHETKIGILAIVSIALLIWGYTYLKGRNILTTSQLMYVEYPKVDMLAISAPVLINGFRVGVVADMHLKEEDMRTIVVELDIDRGVKIPKNTIAVIISTDITGGKGIRLEFDKPCDLEDCAKSGDFLKGRVRGLLGSMVPKDELTSYLDQISGTVGEVWDTIGGKMSDPDAKGIAESIRNFNALTANLNELILGSSRSIEATMAHLSSIMGKIDEDNEKISDFLTNLAAFSEKLNNLDLDKTMSNVNGTMTSTDSAMVELKTTLRTADEALAKISELVDGVKAGEGTIGKFFTNDSLYYNLSNTSQQLEVLLKDLEEKPYRYIPFKGRNKVNRYDKKDEKQKGN
jgi:phospholipid/cholesterol/gamma-HCH transport system substrate-binding protein